MDEQNCIFYEICFIPLSLYQIHHCSVLYFAAFFRSVYCFFCRLHISILLLQVAITFFHSNIKHLAYLSNSVSSELLLQALATVQYNATGTNLGAALVFEALEVFSDNRGDRFGVENVLILMTDGDSSDDITNGVNVSDNNIV